MKRSASASIREKSSCENEWMGSRIRRGCKVQPDNRACASTCDKTGLTETRNLSTVAFNSGTGIEGRAFWKEYSIGFRPPRNMAFINDGERALATSEVKYLELVRDGEQGSHTRVSWTMDGDTATFAPPILSGYMTFLMNDRISSDFDLGLAKLKERVEAGG